MLPDFRLGEDFFAFLEALDAKIARQVALAGCRHCGGPLHQGNYQRKPRGGRLARAGEQFALRHSLCCGRKGCRKRALPPSLRFLARRVYLGAVVLLASVVAQLAFAQRDARSVTGVPLWTLQRWGSWWSEVFPQSPTWAELRARFAPPPPNAADLPRSLVVRLDSELQDGTSSPKLSEVCRMAAQCLAPATTTSVADASRFVRAVAADSEPA